MNEVAVRVENLGKKFLIGHRRSGDLRETFGHALRKVFQRGFTKQEEFWALKDVDLEIKSGDVVGIIGRNGAGKSTLLKILSRITLPTIGRFEIYGRVSSLLEVGTGFHPELTGRENIFLNGTILGMRRAEIRSKFDEIVAFSGVEDFIDTAVKHYSSGMKVRLAFSVAAHLQPEILIVDEVLAVGDAEFQKKCLGKMDDVSRKEGRTILFVSHNLAAVGQLCNSCVLLQSGRIGSIGKTDTVIHQYLIGNKSNNNLNRLINSGLRKGSGEFKVQEIRLLNEHSEPVIVGRTGNPLVFELQFDKKVRSENGAFRIDLAIDSESDARVGWFSSDVMRENKRKEFGVVQLRIPKFGLGSGTYFLTFYITWKGRVVDYIHQAFSFEVEEGDFFGTGKVIPKSQTFIYAEHDIVYY